MPIQKISKAFVEQMVEEITKIHEDIITQSGGHHGIRDKGGLYNSVHKSLRYYYSHRRKPASVGAYAYAELARRHHFADGNKRTAHVFAKILLFMANRHFKIVYKDAVAFIMEIAKYQSITTFEEIEQWISPHLIEISTQSPETYIKRVMLEFLDGSQ